MIVNQRKWNYFRMQKKAERKCFFLFLLLIREWPEYLGVKIFVVFFFILLCCLPPTPMLMLFIKHIKFIYNNDYSVDAKIHIYIE